MEGEMCCIPLRSIFWGESNCGHYISDRLTIFGRVDMLYIIGICFSMREFNSGHYTNLFWKGKHVIYYWDLLFDENLTVATMSNRLTFFGSWTYYILLGSIFWGEFDCGHYISDRLIFFERWGVLYIIRICFSRRI